jgi:hypothetical protein
MANRRRTQTDENQMKHRTPCLAAQRNAVGLTECVEAATLSCQTTYGARNLH